MGKDSERVSVLSTVTQPGSGAPVGLKSGSLRVPRTEAKSAFLLSSLNTAPFPSWVFLLKTSFLKILVGGLLWRGAVVIVEIYRSFTSLRH